MSLFIFNRCCHDRWEIQSQREEGTSGSIELELASSIFLERKKKKEGSRRKKKKNNNIINNIYNNNNRYIIYNNKKFY